MTGGGGGGSTAATTGGGAGGSIFFSGMTSGGERFAWSLESDGGDAECGADEGGEGATEGVACYPDVGVGEEVG